MTFSHSPQTSSPSHGFAVLPADRGNETAFPREAVSVAVSSSGGSHVESGAARAVSGLSPRSGIPGRILIDDEQAPHVAQAQAVELHLNYGRKAPAGVRAGGRPAPEFSHSPHRFCPEANTSPASPCLTPLSGTDGAGGFSSKNTACLRPPTPNPASARIALRPALAAGRGVRFHTSKTET